MFISMKQVMMMTIKEYVHQEEERIAVELKIGTARPKLLIIDPTENDPANQRYIKNKMKDCEKVGLPVELMVVHSSEEIREAIASHRDWQVIVQMPSKYEWDYNWLRSNQDADGLSKFAQVQPATVRGIMDYLRAIDFPIDGCNAVVVGRSDIVGKPMARALLDANATVTVCHSHTSKKNLLKALMKADLVIPAIGRAKYIKRGWCPSAFVVDVGINVGEDGKLCGDFEESAAFCRATPVPGGVGLLTRLGLVKNCLELAKENLDGQTLVF